MWIWKSIDEEFLGMHGLALPHDLQKSLGGMSFTETAVYFKERFRLTQTLEEIKDCWNAVSYTHLCRCAMQRRKVSVRIW